MSDPSTESRAKLLEEAKEIVGNTPLEIAAKDHPMEAWTVWSSMYSKHYPEGSEELKERRRVFLENAESVRTWNAVHSDDKTKFRGLNMQADVPVEENGGGMASAPYTGPIRVTNILRPPRA